MKESRRTVDLRTHIRIKEFFLAHENKEFAATRIRNELNLDYYSVLFCLHNLVKSNFIQAKNKRYVRFTE